MPNRSSVVREAPHFPVAVLVLAGCGTGAATQPDLAAPPVLVDLSILGADGMPLRDFSPWPDLGPSADLAAPPDLVAPPDCGATGQTKNAAVACGNAMCSGPTSLCCKAGPVAAGTCEAPCSPCALESFYCDQPSDCKNPGDVCCLDATGARCLPLADCMKEANWSLGCVGDGDCPGGQHCCGVGPSPSFHCSAGPCPISRLAAKTDVHYLDDSERRRLRDALLDLRLSTWRYRKDPSGPPHLGFIIDDVGQGPEVAADGQTVDLYGYTSMAVAALQEQQREIEALRREVADLRRNAASSPSRKRRPGAPR